jgi:hypothetical protein
MKYRLSRPCVPSEYLGIVRRAIRKQKIEIPRATKQEVRELARISKTIEKKGLPSHLVCKKLKGKLGRGIFLHPNAKPIMRGEVIASYAGDVTLIPQNRSDDSDYAFFLMADIVLTKEEQRVVDQSSKYHPRRLYALDLDAIKRGNFTRFINHSEKPNVEAHLLKIPRNSSGLAESPLEIIYIAKRTIRPGEQVLVCYEDEEKGYWGVMQIVPFPMTAQTFRLDSSLNIY